MRNSTVIMFCGTALMLGGSAFHDRDSSFLGGLLIGFALMVIIVIAWPEPQRRRTATRRSR